MITEKLNVLGRLMDENPTSPQVQTLAARIKSECRTTEEEKMIEDFVGQRLAALTDMVDTLREDAIRAQLAEIGDMINLSYIAKTYFKKSRAWLSQRINGNTVNGKTCRFTPDELDIFNDALHDMSNKLSCVTVRY